jgi:formate dehydrogenase subunit beta
MKNELYLAQTTDKEILEKADCGGAVTTLLKFALQNKLVDAVFAVKKKAGNRFNGVLEFVTDPNEVNDFAGALHNAPVNLANNIKKYLDGANSVKIATVCKPCDARAIIELAKREQINLDNLIMIGVNCTGTFAPAKAKEMLIEEFKVDPKEVVREDIDDGKLIITLKDGTEKSMDLMELEEKGYGRRENCRRCTINIPRMADLACGKWGTSDNKTTFIEVCSAKGSDLLMKAVKKEVIKVKKPDDSAIRIREEKDKAEIERAEKIQQRVYGMVRDLKQEDKFAYWMNEFNKCIKCFGCRDACPICYCKECILEAKRGYLNIGEIPPDQIFPLTRLAHVGHSCVNCGQCQDVCPMEIPLSMLFSMLNHELIGVFGYVPGLDVEEKLPLFTATDEELKIDDKALRVSSIAGKK